MPYTIPHIRISPEDCLLEAPQALSMQVKDIIDIFQHMSPNSYRDLPLGCEINGFVKNREYNIYLTGGRAFYLVLTSLKAQLKGVFWESFDWTLLEKLYSKDRDYDIQCCWKNRVIVRKFDEIMKESFRAMKSRIKANFAVESDDTMVCSNGDIDIAWIQKQTSHIDILSHSFRINLLTHEVECLNKEGLNLLLNEHQIDIPNILEYINHPNKNRALSKMTFAIRNMAKSLTLGFTLSQDTVAAMTMAISKRPYAHLIQAYATSKMSELRKEYGDEKLGHMDTMAGLASSPWLDRLLQQNRKNIHAAKPTLLCIPAANIDEILTNIHGLAEAYSQPKDKTEAIEQYIKDTLRYYISVNTLEALIAELEKPSSNQTLYSKILVLCKAEIKKTQTTTAETKREVVAVIAPYLPPPPSSTAPEASSQGTRLPILNAQRAPQPRVRRINHRKREVLAKITKECIHKFKQQLDREFMTVYVAAGICYDEFEKGPLLPRHGDIIKNLTNVSPRIIVLVDILLNDKNILFFGSLHRFNLSLMYVTFPLFLILVRRAIHEPRENEENISLIHNIIEVSLVFCAFLIGQFRPQDIYPDTLNRWGLDDCMQGLSKSLSRHENSHDNESHYLILMYIGMCIKYSLYFMRNMNAVETIKEIGDLFLEDKRLSVGILHLTTIVYGKQLDTIKADAYICEILKVLAIFEVKEVVLILTSRNFSLEGISPEDMLADFEEALSQIRTTVPSNHNGAQYETKHPLQSLQI